MRLRWLYIAALTAPATAHAQVGHDAQAWFTVNTTGTIGGPIQLNLEALGRLSNDQNRIYEAEFTAQLGYRLSRQVTLWGGYSSVPVYRDGLPPRVERRIRQQLSANLGSLFGGQLSSRTLLEERFRPNEADMGWRLRQRFLYAHPLRKAGKINAVVWHESFVELNQTVWGQQGGYRRMRNFVGLSVPVLPQVRAEIGYMNQYDIRRAAADQTAHIAAVTLSYAF